MAEIYGTPADDTLLGTSGDDIIHAGAGKDWVQGKDGNDVLHGEDGDDNLSGGAGNNRLYGGEGNDSVGGGDDDDEAYGEDGDDYLHGYLGADVLDGGAGKDEIGGGAGDDIIRGAAGADRLIGGYGQDHVDGGDDDDWITGGLLFDHWEEVIYADVLRGGAGDDTIWAGYGDSVDGGAGTDILYWSFNIGSAAGTAGVTADLRQLANNGTVTVAGATITGIEYIRGPISLTDFDDQVIAGAVWAGEGLRMDGWGGNDELTGTAAADQLYGGNGDDVLRGGGGLGPYGNGDSLDGGNGNDILYAGADGASLDGWTGNDRLYGGGGADDIDGGDGDDVVTGGAGADILYGGNNFSQGPGVDTLDYSKEDGGGDVYVNMHTYFSGMPGPGPDGYIPMNRAIDTYGNLETIGEFENVITGAGNDSVYGNFSANRIETGAGNDVLDGGGGNDVMIGGAGDDTYWFEPYNVSSSSTPTGTIIELAGGGTDEVAISFRNFSLAGVAEVENLTGYNNNGGALTGNGLDNVIRAAGGADTIDGASGNDRLDGGAGNDRLQGGAGDDTLIGGAGTDTAIFGSAAVVTRNGAGWTATSSDGTDSLAGIEIVDGPGANTLLVGSGGFATIQEAVNAAQDGDTILIAGGTYVEQVVVNGRSNLTLRALPGDQVTIEAPADVHETARSSGDREVHAVVTVIGSTNVKIENIDVDGRGAGNTVDEGSGSGTANFVGIYYRNSSGGLVDVDVTATRDPYAAGTTPGGHPVLGSARRGIGVIADNDSGYLPFTMTGGSISDFQTDGAVFQRANLTITGVTVTGNGAQPFGQNGIRIANSVGTIADNIVGAIGVTGGIANTYSGLISVSGSVGLHVTGNHLTGANAEDSAARAIGIFFTYSNTNTHGGSITGNTISHVDTGIYLLSSFDLGGMPIANNVVTNLDGTNRIPLGVQLVHSFPHLAAPLDVEGTEANDSIAAGGGADHLSGLGGDDNLNGAGGADLLEGGSGDDRIDGAEGDDVLSGGGDDDILAGGAGDDDYAGGDGIDTLDFSGETGPVSVNLSLFPGYYPGGPFATRALGAGEALDSFGNYEAVSGIENLLLTAGDDQAYGNEGANRIEGGDGNDDIDGFGGNDILLGGEGLDSLNGWAGDDRLEGGGGAYDFLSGGDGNDVIDAGEGHDMAWGGSGDDSIDGGDGSDSLLGEEGNDSIVAGAGWDLVRGGAGNDHLSGGDDHDVLEGDSGDDVLSGGDGNDDLTGGSGVDSFDGGADPDSPSGDRVTFNDRQANQSVVADLRTGIISNDGFGNTETMTGIEGFGPGTAFADTYYGNDDPNRLMLGRGDFAYGFGGDDEIGAGLAPALADGGSGTDRMILSVEEGFLLPDSDGDGLAEFSPAMSAGWKVDLFAGTIRDGFGNSGTVAGIEILIGSELADDLRANGGDNAINGAGGNDNLRLQDGGDDIVYGGEGNDNIFMIGSLTAADVVDGGAGTDTVVLQGAYAGGITLSANVTNIELISILAGSNINFGEPGTNRHDYVLTVNDSNFSGGIQVRVNGSALLAGEDFTFDGSAELDSRFVVYGGRGKDTLTGSRNNDIFFLAEERFATGDTVNGGAGYDGMFLRGNYTIDFNAPGYTGLFTNIENLTLTSATDERYARGGGTEFDYNVTLSDAIVKPGETLTVSGALLMANETMILDGSAETDGSLSLFGGKASDTLKGGALADLIHGNLGADQLTGNGGADTFRYQGVGESTASSLDHILDFAAGVDKVDLSRMDADTNSAGNQAFAWIGTNAFSGTAGQLRAYQDGSSWFVEGDTNGDSIADLVIQLTVNGGPLTQGDFLP